LEIDPQEQGVPSVSVRRAHLFDLERIVPLFDGYRQFYAQPSDEDAVRTFLRSRLVNQDSVLFVAEADGRAIGFAQLYPSFSSVSMAPILILNDLFVSPEARGSGVGRSLLAAAAQHAHEVGAIRLSLATAITNKVGQTLYEGAGWRRDEEFYVYHLVLGN
jgi:GNAT superfamily N-acetyltransferase